jgi:hypothetical protein
MRILALLTAVALTASPIAAQGSTAVGLRSLPVAHTNALPMLQRDAPPRTHWILGGEIGAGFGLGVALFIDMIRQGLCESSDCRGFHPMYFLAPMGFFAFIGSMIGSGFRKD